MGRLLGWGWIHGRSSRWTIGRQEIETCLGYQVWTCGLVVVVGASFHSVHVCTNFTGNDGAKFSRQHVREEKGSPESPWTASLARLCFCRSELLQSGLGKQEGGRGRGHHSIWGAGECIQGQICRAVVGLSYSCCSKNTYCCIGWCSFWKEKTRIGLVQVFWTGSFSTSTQIL